ncbi:MAG: hypothetical protein HOO88_01685 [Kiritimatiellaceae bacterium]|nr:hypothetical protein [Kiritimatiellaceae bacterium]
MNSFRTSERLSSLLAFALSGLSYISVGVLVIVLAQRNSVEKQPAMGPKAVSLSFAQIELQAVAASPAESAPVPVLPRPPPEPADVALEEIQKAPEPEPKIQPEVSPSDAVRESKAPAMAQVAQEASASGVQVNAAESMAGTAQKADWRALAIAKLRAMVEREKFYPAAAQKAGYTGEFKALIRLEPDGTISGCSITARRGHPLIGKAVETTLDKIRGRSIGQTLPERFDILLPIEYELR